MHVIEVVSAVKGVRRTLGDICERGPLVNDEDIVNPQLDAFFVGSAARIPLEILGSLVDIL